MELEVLRHYGIPETGVISIRAGGTRRQALLSSLDRPLKFPCAPEECTTFKVDVFDQLGSARLAYNPGEHEYSLTMEAPVEGADPPGMEVAFCIRKAGEHKSLGGGNDTGDLDDEREHSSRKPGKLSSPKGPANEDDKLRDEKKELSAREYLEKHGLTTFMQFLMQSLMKDKPADPYSFLQKQVTKRMVSELAKSVGDSPEERGLEALLAGANVEAPSVTTEQLADLEKEAAATCEQLRLDNLRLRETAAHLKSRYWQLLQDSQLAPSPPSAVVDRVPLYTGPGLPPLGPNETPQLAAYREIAAMQDEVSTLARENGALVEELARMRSQIDSVRAEVDGFGGAPGRSR